MNPCFGHPCDGNFHCILSLIDSDSEEYIDSVNSANDNQRTSEAGGTYRIDEHGIDGHGKIKYL